MIIVLCAILTCISGALVELNTPCGSSFDCVSGAICQGRICQCPPVYMAAASGCVHAPVPVRSVFPAVSYNVYRHPYPLFVQQVAVQAAPAPATALTSNDLLWSAAIKSQATQVKPQEGAPEHQDKSKESKESAETAAGSHPHPHPQPQPQKPAPVATAPIMYAGMITEYGYQFATPGASCLQKQLCLGNSYCALGSCVCPLNYMVSGSLCIFAAKPAETLVATATVNVTAVPPTVGGGDNNETATASTEPPVTLPPVPVPVPAVVPETLSEALKTPLSIHESSHASRLVELKAAPWFNYVPIPIKPAEPVFVPATATAVIQAAPVPAVNPCAFGNTIIVKELCRQVYQVQTYQAQPQLFQQAYPLPTKVESHAAHLWSKILNHPLYGATVLDYKPHPYIASEYSRYAYLPYNKQKRS